MKKNTKWIERLLDKITDGCKTTNNENFSYYGKEVTLQSGTEAYVSVLVNEKHNTIMDFSLDFWTHECVIDWVEYPEYLDAIKSALRKLYYRNWTFINNMEEEEEYYNEED